MRVRGSLVVVGTGIMLASQCTPEARRAIERADLVYAVVGPIVSHWLSSLNANVLSLEELYREGQSRLETYVQMRDTILESVRSGKNVCAAFYGHPGVFVRPAHEAIGIARAEGFEAVMLPGISAEDCLCADLSVDPGEGWQSYEAQDFYIHARKVDTSAALVLWQLAVFGDESFTQLRADQHYLGLLADVLMEDYPTDHGIVVYEAATLPVSAARIQRLPLCELTNAVISQLSTLYVPPFTAPKPVEARLALLRRAR